MKISETMTEQEYRAIDAISASDLVAILACPAKWRYGEKTETATMALGTASHAALLEPAKFSNSYYRVPEHDDYTPPAADTVTEIRAALAAAGIKVLSGVNKSELVVIAMAAGITTIENERNFFAMQEAGKAPLSAKDWHRVRLMSSTIHAQPEYSSALVGAAVEVSITDIEYMGVMIKARLDVVTKNGELWDYKTTTDASPEAFGRAAHNYSYWLKMAFYHDMFSVAYGQVPKRTVLLAQEKAMPYLCQAYALTPAQLQAGRTAYQMALGIYKRCTDSNIWPAYGGGVMELDTPSWAGKNDE